MLNNLSVFLRKITLSTLLGLFFIPLVAISSVSAAPASPLAAEVFYHLPAIQQPLLSPDGTHLLAFKNAGGYTSVMVVNLATGVTFYPTKTDNVEFRFDSVRWANNDRILLRIIYAKHIEGLDASHQNARLLSMDAKKPSEMVAVVQFKEGEKSSLLRRDAIVGVPGADNDHILMAIGDTDRQGRPSVQKVDIRSGKRKMLKIPDVDVSTWYADLNGNVRAGYGIDGPSEKIVIKILDPRKNEWVIAWSYKQLEEKGYIPVGFGGNPNELYLFADYNGRRALYKADLMQDGYPLTLVLHDDKYDLAGELIYLPTRKDAVGLKYYSGGEAHNLFWNDELKKLQAGLIRALPNARSSVVSVSDDLRKYIVFTSDDTNPGSYLYGNRDTKELLPIADTYPELNGDVLVKKELLSFKARDGVALSGYLSRSKNAKKTPAPLVVLVPTLSDRNFNSQFDALSALLVNRGYSVYQPNINESRSRNAYISIYSIGSIGLLLQHDIEDAAKYLLENKITSAEGMCIAGKEYGGFTALMASVNTPTLFKCAISHAGISNISKVLGSYTYWGNKDTMRENMGSDQDQLINATPVKDVEKIKAPILLIHASDDSYVRVQQSQMMAEELKRLNKTYEYIELEGGSHELEYLPHRKKVFEAVAAFLQKYLPVE